MKCEPELNACSADWCPFVELSAGELSAKL